MERNAKEGNCQIQQNHQGVAGQGQDAVGELIRRGQQLHDAFVYDALSCLVGLVARVFSIGRDKLLARGKAKRGGNRGWAPFRLL